MCEVPNVKCLAHHQCLFLQTGLPGPAREQVSVGGSPGWSPGTDVTPRLQLKPMTLASTQWARAYED